MKKLIILGFLIGLVSCVHEPTADNRNNTSVDKTLNLPLVNIGTVANDGTGDPLRTAFGKVNNVITQVNANTADIALRLPISDTLNMLRNYVNIIDYPFSYLDPTSSVQTQINALSDLIASQRANYYVDQVSGNDANTGLSPTAAWKTIAKVNAHTFKPGDNIFFKRGCEWREQLTISQSGTSDNRIVYSAYGTGVLPIINGADRITGWADQGSNVWSINCPNVTTTRCMVVVDNVLFIQVATLGEVTSASTYFIDVAATPDKLYIYSVGNPDAKVTEVSKRDYGIYTIRQKYLTLSYLEVRNAGSSGMELEASSLAVNSQTIVDYCKFYRNRNNGIFLTGGYGYCTVQNCDGSYSGQNFISSGDYSVGGLAGSGNIFSHCTSSYAIKDYIMDGSHTDGSGFQLFNSNGIIEYCTSTNDNFGIFLDPYTNANAMICRYNTVLRSTGQGIGVTDPALGGSILIYYNLVVNSGSAAEGSIYSEHDLIGLGTIYIYNNTIYLDNSKAQSYGIWMLHGANHVIKNNIISYPTAYGAEDYYSDLRVGDTDAFISDYNLFYHGASNPDYVVRRVNSFYSNLAAWRAILSLDTNSLESDPLFTSAGTDFTLQTGSPCKNTGVVIATIPQTDILGNPIIGVPDIGCYEKQ